MRAIVRKKTGGPEVLSIEERPTPTAQDGSVVIAVKAFGLNRAELISARENGPTKPTSSVSNASARSWPIRAAA
jgi:NADPH:quinone reductase-like Zn-dependent oxidoreductase